MSDATKALTNKLFPHLADQLRLAQMEDTPERFALKCLIPSVLFSANISFVFFLIFLSAGIPLLALPILVVMFFIFYLVCINLPRFNIQKVRLEIEQDIFIPARMMLTLLESGNSLVTALEGVSYTKAKSSKYFGKIASEIYLGKNIDQAIEDAIEFTPSESFRRVLEPIKKSLKTGTDIQNNLYATLQSLQQEKIVEIEKYEKVLNPLSMFYMIFGTIMPAVGSIVAVVILSVIGIEVVFFPFLFIFLLFILLLQVIFIRIFRSVRPLVTL